MEKQVVDYETSHQGLINLQLNGGDLYYLHLAQLWVSEVGPPEELVPSMASQRMSWYQTEDGWLPIDGGHFVGARRAIDNAAIRLGLATALETSGGLEAWNEPTDKSRAEWNELTDKLGAEPALLRLNRSLVHTLEIALRRLAHECIKARDPSDPVFDDMRSLGKRLLVADAWYGSARDWPAGTPDEEKASELEEQD